jgi:hypothetical protein
MQLNIFVILAPGIHKCRLIREYTNAGNSWQYMNAGMYEDNNTTTEISIEQTSH